MHRRNTTFKKIQHHSDFPKRSEPSNKNASIICLRDIFLKEPRKKYCAFGDFLSGKCLDHFISSRLFCSTSRISPIGRAVSLSPSSLSVLFFLFLVQTGSGSSSQAPASAGCYWIFPVYCGCGVDVLCLLGPGPGPRSLPCFGSSHWATSQARPGELKALPNPSKTRQRKAKQSLWRAQARAGRATQIAAEHRHRNEDRHLGLVALFGSSPPEEEGKSKKEGSCSRLLNWRAARVWHNSHCALFSGDCTLDPARHLALGHTARRGRVKRLRFGAAQLQRQRTAMALPFFFCQRLSAPERRRSPPSPSLPISSLASTSQHNPCRTTAQGRSALLLQCIRPSFLPLPTQAGQPARKPTHLTWALLAASAGCLLEPVGTL